MADFSDLAIRHAATRVRVVRPGVEPQAAVAVIEALLAMGWQPPPPPEPRSQTTLGSAATLEWRTIGNALDDAQTRLATAIDACTELGKSFAALIIAKETVTRQRDALAQRLGKRFDQQAIATRLVEFALHLRQHGERAPGGTETWRDFDRNAEAFLRSDRGEAGCVWPERACTGCATCLPLRPEVAYALHLRQHGEMPG